MSKIYSLVVKHKSLALGGLAFLLIVIWLLLPGQADLEKYNDLFKAGNYQATRVGLERALNREPDWHEARELLVRVELAEGGPVEAMGHALVLFGSGWEMRFLEGQFNVWLNLNWRDTEKIKPLFEQVEQGLDQYVHWPWLREFGLRLVTRSMIEELPGYLLWLEEEDFELHWSLMDQGIKLAIESGDWALAWQVAEVLDNRPFVIPSSIYGNYYPHIGQRVSLLSELDRMGIYPERWSALQAVFPGEPLLAISLASIMEPKEGLDWLVEWEEENEVNYQAAEYYSVTKMGLLSRSDSNEIIHLANVAPRYILWVAMNDLGNEEKFELILTYLKQFPEMAEKLDVARLAARAPEPDWVIDAFGGRLTPNGENIVLWGVGTGEYQRAIMDLRTGQISEFQMDANRWAPCGARVALALTVGGQAVVEINSFRGDLEKSIILPGIRSHTIWGWKDGNILWLSGLETNQSGVGTLFVLDIRDGNFSKVEAAPILSNGSFVPGPGGKIAWGGGIDDQDRFEVGVLDGRDIQTFWLEAEKLLVRDWLPDGSGLILIVDNEIHTLGMDGNLQGLNLPRYEGHSNIFHSWRNKYEFYWNYPITSGYSMLAIYNIRTGQVTLTGIVNPISVAGNRAAVSTGRGQVYVYDLR